MKTSTLYKFIFFVILFSHSILSASQLCNLDSYKATVDVLGCIIHYLYVDSSNESKMLVPHNFYLNIASNSIFYKFVREPRRLLKHALADGSAELSRTCTYGSLAFQQ